MIVLALEFSSLQRSVAVVDGRGTRAEIVQAGGQGVPALAMIDQALSEAGLSRELIECVAIGIGPGSYTGIRGAIALAQGWQLASGVKLSAISSVECIAQQARADGAEGPVTVILDAQRKEFYRAAFRLARDGIQETEPLALVSFAAAEAEVKTPGKLVMGPQVSKWFPQAREAFPRAATLAELAARARDFVPGEQIEPIYLRKAAFIKAPPPRKLPD